MIRLRTLGGLSIEGIEGPPTAAANQRRHLALLALLAIAGERGVSREKLLAYLWPESQAERARHALAQSLYALRRALGADSLFLETTELRLNPEVLSSDVGDFERALDRRELSEAVALYAGPFLDGLSLPDAPEFERWVEGERARLELRYRAALESLAADARAARDHRAAAGDRAGALLHARVHEALLREEYDAAPNAAVRAIAERLKDEPPRRTSPEPPTEAASQPPTTYDRRSSAWQPSPGTRPGADQRGAREQHSSSHEPGSVVADRYLIERELGRGGMSTVYLARDLKHNREVALKVVHGEFADPLSIERFQREIETVAKLQHPHILPLYDSGETVGSLYYVMPYVGGGSLRDRLEREKQLPLADALRIAREVADALALAHRHGVVHRDIKPENVLFSSGHALVGDFGIARAVSRAAASRLTDDGIAVGSPAYMSPEQASADVVDGRSDIYSLGCVLYEMLAGTRPFTGTSSRSIVAQRFTSLPQSLRTVRDTIPPNVDDIVLKALARTPADRYQTAEELVAAIDAATVVAPSRHESAPPRARPWRWVVGGVLAAGLVTVVLANRPARVDPELYVVFPFQHVRDATPQLITGENYERLLYDELGRWEGVKLVNDLRARDALKRLGKPTPAFDDLLATARSLRAGNMAWGEIFEANGVLHVRATLYDVAKAGAAVRQVTVPVPSNDATVLGRQVAQIADSLLVALVSEGKAVPPGASAGIGGTRSLAALAAYLQGHQALADWKLDSAQRNFRNAITIDPSYAHANLWLARVMLWESDDAGREWQAIAGRAAALRSQLGKRDSAAAEALEALADERYPQACAQYAALVRRDSLDFEAWYGVGECHRRDRLVLRDPTSPSGWNFRSSYRQAIAAYRRALEIVPSFQAALGGAAYARLPRLLFTEHNQFRAGFAPERDTLRFAAFPSLDHDTLAFVPYPLEDVLAGRPGTNPPTIADAVRNNRELLRDITTHWVRTFPGSAPAHQALSRVLELVGEIDAPRGGSSSALSEIRQARRSAATDDERLRSATDEVRLLVKLSAFAAAKALADSQLAAWPQPSPSAALQLSGLAALTGRVHRAAQLLREAAPADTIYTAGGVVDVPVPLHGVANALLAYAAVGAPVDSIVELERRVESMVRSWRQPSERESTRYALLDWPAMLAYPQLGVAAAHRPRAGGNPIIEMQWALARGDTAAVRARFDALREYRKFDRPGDISIEFTYQEAWLHLAMRDSAKAAELLDLSLSALPTLGTSLVEKVQQAAALVRAMALRAELAARAEDRVTAQRWARSVLELWRDADPELRPSVDRMRALASDGL